MSWSLAMQPAMSLQDRRLPKAGVCQAAPRRAADLQKRRSALRRSGPPVFPVTTGGGSFPSGGKAAPIDRGAPSPAATLPRIGYRQIEFEG